MENEVKVVKKRGRKPKPKVDVEIESNTKIPKKRGRKPKPKTETDLVEKIPKKRGRKPKEKVYSVSKQFINEDNNEENIILHLPILQSEIDNINNSSLVEYNDNETDNPNPYEPELNFQEINNKDVKKEEYKYETNEEIKPSLNKNTTENYEELQQVNDNSNKKLVKRNLSNIMYEFIDGNNRLEWPKSTNIYCLWCCHPFDSIPCALPEKLINDKFYLSGCFCSFNCAASYNFDQTEYNVWERYTLLNLLYKKIYNTEYMKIKLAPPKKTLKIFGGFLSIEEFRKNFLINKEYNVIYPPMISLIPTIEEHIFEDIIDNNSFIPLNENNVQQVELKLKRNKPLTDPKKTLESYMDLKIL